MSHDRYSVFEAGELANPRYFIQGVAHLLVFSDLFKNELPKHGAIRCARTIRNGQEVLLCSAEPRAGRTELHRDSTMKHCKRNGVSGSPHSADAIDAMQPLEVRTMRVLSVAFQRCDTVLKHMSSDSNFLNETGSRHLSQC